MTVEPVMMRMVPNSGPLFLPGPLGWPKVHLTDSLPAYYCKSTLAYLYVFGYKVYTEYCIWCIIALCTKCILVCYEKEQPTQDTVYCKCCVMAIMNVVSIV